MNRKNKKNKKKKKYKERNGEDRNAIHKEKVINTNKKKSNQKNPYDKTKKKTKMNEDA